ncbi:AAA family ATPase [Nitrosovibrio sp. Nv4]|uniref:AAA family ATPase n=1 Tax=Nitrosovibrio sp. Nv4 TaxID=1945880 RepID=UPI000BDCD6A8|nr:AAA family ATPase [Nitrosovibrio sp. Nv4]SOD40559.1 AAA domain-containing protein [Nitrosovibrio sp. Nv4]
MGNNISSIERGAAALDKEKKTLTPEQQRYIDRGHGVQTSTKSRLKVTRASEVKPQPVRWLWPGKIALGKPTLIAGDPGLGKSMLTVSFAAHVSTGRDWPAGGGICPQGDVLFVSAEDDPADTIRPRLDAAGADPARVHIVGGVESLNRDGGPETRLLSLRRDLEPIREAALTLPQCRLIVVDPVSAYLDGADSHNNAEVRGVIAPLSELASSIGAAIIFVTHLNKGTGGSALYRSTGSLAFVAAARAAFLVTKDKSDQNRRLFLPLKNNLGPDATGMAYHIEEAGGVPRVVWEKEIVLISADDALGREDDQGDHESTLAEDAAEWLCDVLANGPVPSDDVKKYAKGAGYSWATVRRAQATLGIKPRRHSAEGETPCWRWALPDEHKGAQMSLNVTDE